LSDHFSENKFYLNKSNLLATIKTIDLNQHNTISIGVIVSSGGNLEEEGFFFRQLLFNAHPIFFEELFNSVRNSFDTSSSQTVRNRKNPNTPVQNYLVIANKGNTLEFCLNIPSGTLPLPKTYISSF
jgi:hypothetical protein